MYHSKNVPLGMKGQRALVLQYSCRVILKEVCPECVLHENRCHHQNSLAFLALMSIQWMPGSTAESATFLWAKQQASDEPYRGSWSHLHKLSGVSFLIEPCP